MELTVKVEGLEKLKPATAAVIVEVKKQIDAGLYASAKQVESDAKRSVLQGKKSGAVYKRRTVQHRASAPGEAPANDTGRLASSIVASLVRGANYAVVTAGKGVAKYATMLEFGTSKMAARPFLFPAAERNRKWINDRMARAMQMAIKNSDKKG